MTDRLLTIRCSVICIVAVVGWSLVMQSTTAQDNNKSADKPLDFERELRPIFVKHCVSCHGKKRQEGGLRLDNRNEALRGGDSGQVIVVGDASGSLLVKRVTSTDESLRMPLDKPAISPRLIQLLRKWIDGGARWPVEKAASRLVSDHWSFQPIERPRLPSMSLTKWARNSIDMFVLARLNRAEITPSPAADRAKLIRRLHLDLIGLPPEPSDVDAFLSDGRSDAYERLVDRLLASPHFGERWGQYWLDLARYADSDGYEMDYARPNAWRWRDWAINAINDDMPFDQFTVEQLAGDLLPGATTQQQVATGFHRNTLTNTENGIDKEEFRVKSIVDRVNTTGTVWLGLTVGCAECHSHKYDPIRQHEFYRLFAFFNDHVDEADVPVAPTREDRAAFAVEQARHETRLRQLETELRSAPSEARGDLEQRLRKLQKSAPQLEPLAQAFRLRAKRRQTYVHRRGNFLDKGVLVSANVPQVLPPLDAEDSSRDRLDLAHWLVDAPNPLTARVEANRLWQHLFGFGLVRTPDDFGTQGEPPTHPELLDWLASELQRQGWSRKQLIRQIVTSATYRQDSALRPDLTEVDPANRLVARQNRYRLDAELIRDQYLAVGNLLNRRIGGPSFYPPLPTGISQLGFRVNWRADPLDEQSRRGIYLVVRRNLAYPMLTTFNRPDANVTCTRRERSNTPMQALTQLNDPLVVDCARSLAMRVTDGKNKSIKERIGHGFRLCLGRRPVMNELRSLEILHERLLEIYAAEPHAATTLLGGNPGRVQGDPTELAAWTVMARTIMNVDEFVNRE